MSSRPAWSVGLLGQPGFHSNTLSLKNKTKPTKQHTKLQKGKVLVKWLIWVKEYLVCYKAYMSENITKE